jgi:GGDEF domain-containing protein
VRLGSAAAHSRIEYIDDVYDFVSLQRREYCLIILDMKNFMPSMTSMGMTSGINVIASFVRDLRKRLPPGSISLRFRHGDEFLFFIPEMLAQAESRFRSFLECAKLRLR